MKQVHLRLEDNQYKEIVEYAKFTGMTVQDAISTAFICNDEPSEKAKEKHEIYFY